MVKPKPVKDLQTKFKPRGRIFVHYLTAFLLLAVCGKMEAASYTLYSNLTSWQAAAGASTTIGFEGLAGNDGYDYVPTPPGITLSGVNFTIDQTKLPSGGSLYVLGQNFAYPGNSVLEAQQSGVGTNNILVTFSSPVSAVAMDFGDRSGTGSTFGFSLSDGVSFDLTTSEYLGTSTPNGFMGLTSTTPITSLEIYRVTSGTELDIDNVSFAVTQVPEPDSFYLTLTGAISFLAFRRPKRQAKKFGN